MESDYESHYPSKRPRLDVSSNLSATPIQGQINSVFTQGPTIIINELNNFPAQLSQHQPSEIYSNPLFGALLNNGEREYTGSHHNEWLPNVCGSTINESAFPNIYHESMLSQPAFDHMQPAYRWPVNCPTPPISQHHDQYHAFQDGYPTYLHEHNPQFSWNALGEHPDFQSCTNPFSQIHQATYALQGNTDERTSLDYDTDSGSHIPQVSQHNVTVCFGMVSQISGTCEQLGTNEILPEFQVQLDSSDRFGIKLNDKINGRIESTHSQMVQGLLDEPTLNLHVNCVMKTLPGKSKSFRNSKLIPCTLEITVYGPMDLYDEIGSWFQEYEIYLQDPRMCYLDVRYYNPQRLSSENFESCPLVSEVVEKASSLVPLQLIAKTTEMLDVLSHNEDLEETPQPETVKATLKRHQKQALTFMLSRERGWVHAEGHKDIWETMYNDRGRMFINTIASTCQSEEPPQFRGGIIADPMGLGKTLTMISLVATDLDPRYGAGAFHIEESIDRIRTPATLIIIPPPLIGTWEEQLAEHVLGGRLKLCRHHGKSRLKGLAELQNMNVILTTFHTVSSEWKADSSTSDSILFAVRWRRIILDEAHFIRNGNSRMSRAVCALESDSRWAVTGTPIQNRLTDLAALLKFIRVHPYDDPRRFEDDILNLWKSGEDDEAVRRLKRLSAFLLLRRPKRTINLPPRQDLLLPIHFNHEERQVYNSMRDQVITRIDEALHDASRSSRAGSYHNALQQIESLRLFCNLGLQYHSRHIREDNLPLDLEEWPKIAQRTFDSQREITPVICMQCSSIVEHTEEWLTESSTIRQSAQFFECLKFVCGDCMEKLHRRHHTVACGHVPPCTVAPVSTNSTLGETSNLVGAEMSMELTGLSSKIKTLVTDLKNESTGAKCVVFSTWRLTLDIVQAGLNNAGIRSIRFDGKVAQRDRQPVIDSFRTDPSIRVMLLTLSCGAVGLTLTVASRAYLMEPHWNPTLEEQALARVHRLGQMKEVTTVRLYVRDSFEEQVMQLQESKKQLAGVLLSPHDGNNADNSLSGLEKLRTLL
ncbi:SNF2 family N-terminal domain-containing protein [Rostrohypoxylon terebratum]|nr:SNF2 family N-terminal domain-containing protein [Rostrohypoxylon terebratum]